jgi:hypothetical protein
VKSKLLFLIFCFAFSFVVAVIAVYIFMFGVERSSDQAVWGAFGDYFGGILNPVFAFFAFLGVLWSLDMQSKQIRQLSRDRHAEEILLVIKDIDSRIRELMEVAVGGVDASELRIHHMIAEAERGAPVLANSDAYAQFVLIARQSGSLVEATVRELRSQVISLHSFLIRYPHNEEGGYAPIIEHYTQKVSGVVLMLREIKALPDAVERYFTSPGDR